MKQIALIAAVLLGATVAWAQVSTGSSSSLQLPQGASTTRSAVAKHSTSKKKTVQNYAPFSRLALGAGVGLMGINGQVTTNLSKNFNLRGTGSLFSYDYTGYKTNGFDISAGMRMASAGASLDYYPFAAHGFRLSAGGLFYNQNRVKANATVAGGQSFTLSGDSTGDQTYYSSTSDPVTLSGLLKLNDNKPSFTATTGWGNHINRMGGHWSFPFEIGAAFTGAPKVDAKLTGSACYLAGDASTCSSLAGNSTLATQIQKTDLPNQLNKWNKDLNVTNVFPIISFGVNYNFAIR